MESSDFSDTFSDSEPERHVVTHQSRPAIEEQGSGKEGQILKTSSSKKKKKKTDCLHFTPATTSPRHTIDAILGLNAVNRAESPDVGLDLSTSPRQTLVADPGKQYNSNISMHVARDDFQPNISGASLYNFILYCIRFDR
jgi:hypothetical protein